MKKQLYQFIFTQLLGWQIKGKINPGIMECVLIIIPHTSWHDFYIGLFARGIIGLEINYVAKKELFRIPFGWWFRWMGGAPLDRTGCRNTVDAMCEVFKTRKTFRMAIAPEGTRAKVSGLRSGFYYIALKAAVPIIPIAFDYSLRMVKIGEPLMPTGNYDADLLVLSDVFRGAKGKIIANGFNFDS